VAEGGDRRATTIAVAGTCPLGLRHRLRVCWRGCRRARAQPGWFGRQRWASRGGDHRQRRESGSPPAAYHRRSFGKHL